MPKGCIDPSGVDDKNEGEKKIRGSGSHRRGDRSGRRISGLDRDGVPSHPKTKRGRQ